MKERIHKDVVIIGAGFSGAVLAERFASRGKKILVIELIFFIFALPKEI